MKRVWRSGHPCNAFVADKLGRIFVTRTEPCVRFIVYRPHTLCNFFNSNLLLVCINLMLTPLKVNPCDCLPSGAGGGHCAALLQHRELQGVQGGRGAESGGWSWSTARPSLLKICCFQVGIELAPAVEHLIGEASCGRIGGQDEGDCDSGLVQFAYSYFLQVVGDLWERGILMTSEPLEAHYDDSWI